MNNVDPSTRGTIPARTPGHEVRLGAILVLASAGAELAFWGLARATGLSPAQSFVAMLAAAVIGVSIVGPVLGACAKDFLRATLRAGLLADGTFVALLVLYFVGLADGRQVQLDIVDLLQIYCTYLAVALAAGAIPGCVRPVVGRYAAAVAVSLFLMAMLAGPFWGNGLIAATHGVAQQTVVAALVYLNPFYSISAVIAAQLGYVIHQAPIAYRITLIGDYVGSPSYPWYSATVIYLGLAGVAFGVHLIASEPRDERERPA